MTVNPFQHAEDEYFRLKGQLATGRITQQQFDAALKQLMIQDAQGRWWMLGADSSKWYVHDGQTWVEASPPTTGVPAPAPPGRPPQSEAGRMPTPPPAAAPPVIVIQSPPYPPAPTASRKGGCCGTGCWVVLAVLVLVVLAGMAFYFRLPQQLGLIQPAAKLLSDTPDREAAATLKEELGKTGMGTTGMDVYVFPYKSGSDALAYVVLDSLKGFTFKSGSSDPIVDLFKQMASTDAVKQYNLRRFTIEYKGITGASVLILTASSDTITGYANKTISREQFLQKLDGQVDWVAFYQETMIK